MNGRALNSACDRQGHNAENVRPRALRLALVLLAAGLMWPDAVLANGVGESLRHALEFCVNPKPALQEEHDRLMAQGWTLAGQSDAKAYGSIVRETWAIEDYFRNAGAQALDHGIMSHDEAVEMADLVLIDSAFDTEAEFHNRIYLHDTDPHLAFHAFFTSDPRGSHKCSFGLSAASAEDTAISQLIKLAKVTDVVETEDLDDRRRLKMQFSSSFGDGRPASGELILLLLGPEVSNAASPPFGLVGVLTTDVQERRKRNAP